MTKRRVFYVQQPTTRDRVTGEFVPSIDISPAEEYGEMIPLLSETANPWGDLSYLATDVERKLVAHQATEQDYLLLVGHVGLQAVVTVVVASMFERWTLLVYSKKRRAYEALEMDLDAWREGPSTDSPGLVRVND